MRGPSKAVRFCEHVSLELAGVMEQKEEGCNTYVPSWTCVPHDAFCGGFFFVNDERLGRLVLLKPYGLTTSSTYYLSAL
jgi:hypothetical protein